MSTFKRTPWNWFSSEEERHPAIRGRQSVVAPVTPLYMSLDRLFDSLFTGSFPAAAPEKGNRLAEAMIRPNLDISGDEHQYVVSVEVPGVSQDDLHVDLDNGMLTISGEKKYEHASTDDAGDREASARNYYRLERSYGSFRRALALPEDVDVAAIVAAHKDGVLTITLPRKKEYLTESRRIEVAKG